MDGILKHHLSSISLHQSSDQVRECIVSLQIYNIVGRFTGISWEELGIPERAGRPDISTGTLRLWSKILLIKSVSQHVIQDY